MRKWSGSFILMSTLFWIIGFASAEEPQYITLATTTSTENTGLLAYLHAEFKQQTGIEVRVIAKGSGAAMELARKGDADVVMAHSPEDEEKFMAEEYGLHRYPLMYNDFVVAGPADDPAKIKNMEIGPAFKQLAESKSAFISRGDQSGTHVKELKIWKEAAIEPAGDWYISIGQGMSKALMMASEKHAYVLTDRGTFLSMKDTLALSILVQGGELLKNPYSVIPVNPAKHPHVKSELADRYVKWLMSAKTQKMIDEFKVGGEQLFFTYLKL